jgi:hypothetical protein
MGVVYSAPMLIILRLIHILSGAFWVGAALFNAILLIPTIRALGPAGGPVMQHLVQVKKLPIWLLGSGILTFLSGFSLYYRASGGFSNGFMQSGPGMTFGLGAVFALLAIIVGLLFTSPAAKRAGSIAASLAGKPPTPEQAAQLQAAQKQIGVTSALATLFVFLATCAMAVARYIP